MNDDHDNETGSDDEDVAHGWDAIDASLAGLYGDQEPMHFGTLLRASLGGPDPLDGISVYRRDLPVPHWHYITYGFTELYEKESDDPETSGYGFELTFRLRAGDETTPPQWVLSLLQNLARYVFKTGNVFNPGDSMSANGPIALETDTKLCSLGFVADPELAPTGSPNGRVAFLQVIGLTVEEERAAKHWQTASLLQVLLPHMPLWITDLHRSSLLELADVAAQVQAGAERDGSSNGFQFTDVLAVQQRSRLLRAPVAEITLGARQAGELGVLLPLRLPFDRLFVFAGPEWRLTFEPGPQCGWRIDDNTITVTLDADNARAFAHAVQPRTGSYQLPGLPSLTWNVQPTLIRDAKGDVVRTIG